jgi:hypothetical protein
MVFGAALLAVLDGTILSATPNLTRVLLALVVTLLVGGFIIGVWVSNSKMERDAAEAEKKPSGGAKAAPGRRTGN